MTGTAPTVADIKPQRGWASPPACYAVERRLCTRGLDALANVVLPMYTSYVHTSFVLMVPFSFSALSSKRCPRHSGAVSEIEWRHDARVCFSAAAEKSQFRICVSDVNIDDVRVKI